ncbi:MAG: inorganic phosphate transporter [Alistipes sp.]|nr:inorganic phosphate transporter [Candidatus Alistipes equi]
MEWIYTFMLCVMVALALTGLFIGVMNDAANFLNSAIASKVASIKVIMAVASAGIIVGAITSSGMMEVARSGMFDPGNFTFRDIMLLYLSVMLANIILLDVYNTLGLPTSTTVALIFCLLGSALATSIAVITSNNEISLTQIGDYINSTRALAIVAGILLSVILAFSCGSFVMYVSRIIFTFSYKKMFRRFGPMWCGISFTAIIYFALFKGLKSALSDQPFIIYISENLTAALVICWVISSVVLYFLSMFRINILKVNILAGTFALALAFAGNDLVNFIGVPVAGFDSYRLALESHNPMMTMEALRGNAQANTLLLLFAGVVMIVTLWTSKRALSVSKTELSLSSQNEGDGAFGSTPASRGLVRLARNINSMLETITPNRCIKFIESRFQKPALSEQTEKTKANYDMIRATVNLTTSAILISIATSMKLPLSTTYVCFMVSMGSSLADKAWGRESAVYRITGVMTVVSGWFVTGFGALIIAFFVALALMYFGDIAVLIISALCIWMLIRSNLKKNRVASKEESKTQNEPLSAQEIRNLCVSEVSEAMRQATRIYDRTMIAVLKEHRRSLKEESTKAEELYEHSMERKQKITSVLSQLRDDEISTAYYYAQMIDYVTEISRSLCNITQPCYNHIDNNHEGMSKDQIEDLRSINEDVATIFSRVNLILHKGDFSEVHYVVEMRDELFNSISEAMTRQLHNIKHNNTSTSTKASILYLTILNETKSMVLHTQNLIKAQRFFAKHSELE